LSLTFQTPSDKLSQIPEIVRTIIESHEGTIFNHAYFKGFDDSGLNFEILYHIESAEFSVYRKIVQSVNIELFQRLEVDEIDLAYPTQTVHVEK